CTTSAGMMSRYVTGCVSLPASFLKVEIESNCTEVSPNQPVQVTVKTIPSYCGITWTGSYITPGRITYTLHNYANISGRLSYEVNPDRKELSVNVSDMLHDHNYHLRLCHKDFICSGTGAYTLIKKEQPIKSATFPYSRPLPCLCIEGWSAVMDAPRVQVCPFKDRIEELWFGITFDPLEEALLWEPACPITAVAALCQKSDDGVCVDLPQSSQNVTREKVHTYKKFIMTDIIYVSALVATGREGREEVKIMSQISATFSVGLCVRSEGSPACQTAETHSVQVVGPTRSHQRRHFF
uniref:Interleukin-17 receptor C/E N-terminal domain-containing protein n=1 Tax=Amphilophus citrinellus TaxID=61819 RepID=A0A3Q0RL92_AMPCI